VHQGNVGLVLLAIALLGEEIVVVTPARLRNPLQAAGRSS
jgi:hypothetical protein